MLMNCWKSCSFCGKLFQYRPISALSIVSACACTLCLCFGFSFGFGCSSFLLPYNSIEILFFLFSAHMQLHASINTQTNAHFGRNMVNARKIKHLWKKIAGKVALSVSIACLRHFCCFDSYFFLSKILFVCFFGVIYFSCSFFVSNRYNTSLYLTFLTGCKDKKKHCGSWAKDGECTKNPDFMNENCAKSCHKC